MLPKTSDVVIIGGWLMGRDFASAVARWCHLTEMNARPELVAVCDANPAIHEWYRNNFPAIEQFSTDYEELLANPGIEAIYCAVPHNLHEEFYGNTIKAGKQTDDGWLDGATTSIVGSGGDSLKIETPALAVLAWVLSRSVTPLVPFLIGLAAMALGHFVYLGCLSFAAPVLALLPEIQPPDPSDGFVPPSETPPSGIGCESDERSQT